MMELTRLHYRQVTTTMVSTDSESETILMIITSINDLRIKFIQ